MVGTRKLSSDPTCPGACTPGNISEIKNLIAIICIKLAEWIITYTSRLDLRQEEKMGSSPSKGRALIRQDSNETPKQMTGTYTAVEVSAPGMLRVVERRISEPGPGQVRIRVEACGICHTDAATVTGIYPGL